MVIIVATTSEEIKEAFDWLTENTGAITIVKTDEIKKQKKSEYDKQRYENKKNSTVKTVENDREKREEEKEGFPPSSPLPFSPNTPYPIPPIIPPSQEKEGERKEIANAAPKPQKHQHGVFSHVMLTDDEYQKLSEKFADAEQRIQNLDDYLENNRKKHYDNHYLTILNWARKDEQKHLKKTWSASEVVEMMSRGEI